MAGVQSCRVVFLYPLVHTQMGHIGIANLEHIKMTHLIPYHFLSSMKHEGDHLKNVQIVFFFYTTFGAVKNFTNVVHMT